MRCFSGLFPVVQNVCFLPRRLRLYLNRRHDNKARKTTGRDKQQMTEQTMYFHSSSLASMASSERSPFSRLTWE